MEFINLNIDVGSLVLAGFALAWVAGIMGDAVRLIVRGSLDDDAKT